MDRIEKLADQVIIPILEDYYFDRSIYDVLDRYGLKSIKPFEKGIEFGDMYLDESELPKNARRPGYEDDFYDGEEDDEDYEENDYVYIPVKLEYKELYDGAWKTLKGSKRVLFPVQFETPREVINEMAFDGEFYSLDSNTGYLKGRLLVNYYG